MDDTLKARHMERITDPAAIAMYDSLCSACDARDGGMSVADQHLIADVAIMEQAKQELMEDIKTHGMREKFKNGRQEMWRENKSVAQLRAYMEQQRKHLAELRVTASGRKAAPISVDSEFADF